MCIYVRYYAVLDLPAELLGPVGYGGGVEAGLGCDEVDVGVGEEAGGGEGQHGALEADLDGL